VDKLALSIPEAVEAAGVGRSLLYEAISRGDLRSLRVSSRRLILTDDLKEWLLGQAAIPAGR